MIEQARGPSELRKGIALLRIICCGNIIYRAKSEHESPQALSVDRFVSSREGEHG